MRKNIIIISASSFGREIFSWLDTSKYMFKGFLDNRPNILTNYQNYHYPIITSAENYEPEKDDLFICAIADVKVKKTICETLLSKKAVFENLIHSSVVIGNNVTFGNGVIVCPNSVISCDVNIGDFVSINCLSGIGHDVIIEPYCQINANVNLCGFVRVGTGTIIQSNSCVIPNVRIGQNCFVGAGSVVLKEVYDGEKVFGNPARKAL